MPVYRYFWSAPRPILPIVVLKEAQHIAKVWGAIHLCHFPAIVICCQQPFYFKRPATPMYLQGFSVIAEFDFCWRLNCTAIHFILVATSMGLSFASWQFGGDAAFTEDCILRHFWGPLERSPASFFYTVTVRSFSSGIFYVISCSSGFVLLWVVSCFSRHPGF